MKTLPLIAAMIVGFSGLRILLLSSYQSKMLGLALSLLGFYFLRASLGPERLEKRRSAIMPAAGILVIAGVLAFNILSTGGKPELKGFDQMTILFGLVLILYNRAPAGYEREARFLALFFGMFGLLQIIPLLLHSAAGALTGQAASMEDSATWYAANFLIKPLSAALNLMGIETASVGDILSFKSPLEWTSVRITLACSGAYSFAIFVSAFTAFVLVKYQKITKKTLMLLSAGILMTYLANLMRMLTTVLAGYYYGGPALVTVHEHLGWLIFMLWTLVFWTIMFKTLGTE